MKKDNAGLAEKVRLRLEALKHLDATPYVLECYAGRGEIGARLYGERGIAIEKDEVKAALLARRRPSWAVYEGDCVAALRAGLAAEEPVNFVDVDPYGDPWPAVEAFLSRRESSGPVVVAVNDGLGKTIKMGNSWKIKSLSRAVDHFGSDLWDIYPKVCRWLFGEIATENGYRLEHFAAFRGGASQQMTHYCAVLSGAAAPAKG